MKQNSTSPFVRKIIYIAAIAGLLLALSFIARPEITDEHGQIVNPGGRLSQMRREHKLAQASISEIDPTSEAMKLASMGLRGVAVNILWMQALEHQKNEDYDKLAATLQTLTKVQPNFVKVWEFQGHNLAFNVSMEFDDYEYRYAWVKKGLEFLKGGIAYNMDDHRMTDNMGFFTGTKFGKSDEKMPFRRIFRKDKEFHSAMSDYIAPDSYDAREYGPDSYKMAWHWYDLSREMVSNGAFKFKSDLMFYMHRPSQVRQQAMILSDEFRTDEVIREIWEDAGDQWAKYGNIELRNAANVPFTLERTDQYEAQIKKLRAELDQLVPGVRKREMMSVWLSLDLTKEEFYLVDAAPEELSQMEKRKRGSFFATINDPQQLFDRGIAEMAEEESLQEARRLSDKIAKVLGQQYQISNDGGVINYSFWKSRNIAEASDAMVRARQAMFDAKEMKRKSIYEDEYVYDYETGEKNITRSGAAKLYDEAFDKWNEVLELHPELIDSPVMDNVVRAMHQYHQLKLFSGKQWPDNFVLQWVVDKRASMGNQDQLPTSQMLRERSEDAADEESADEESADEESADEESGDEGSADAQTTDSDDSDEKSDAESDAGK